MRNTGAILFKRVDQQINVLTYGPQLEEALGSIPEKKDNEELSAVEAATKDHQGHQDHKNKSSEASWDFLTDKKS